MNEVKKGGVWPAAWITGMLAMAMYIIFTVVSLATSGITLGYASLILSVIFGLITVEISGIVLGALAALVYNFIAKRWGGLTLHLKHDIHK